MKPYYQDGSVTLYHGDCRSADLIADALVTLTGIPIEFLPPDEYRCGVCLHMLDSPAHELGCPEHKDLPDPYETELGMSLIGMETKPRRSRVPWRRCSACWGICHWHDTAWVCDDPECGAEWDEEHDARFRPPGEHKNVG